MTEWILVVFVYAGPWAKGDSAALTTIPDFSTQAECMAAGELIKPMEKNTSKDFKYVCVKRTNPIKG